MKSEASDFYLTSSIYQWHKEKNVLWKTKKKKKKSWEKEKEEKRSSTQAFLEVAWDIAKEIPSDITRFYDRELPYETVHAWCSPV